MPQTDLSTLSGFELRGLLESARRRGEATESYEILKEMAERREQGIGRGRARVRGRHEPPGEINFDVADPQDPPVEAEPPLKLTHDDPLEVEAAAAPAEPPLDLALETPAPRRKPRKVRRPRKRADAPQPFEAPEAEAPPPRRTPSRRAAWLSVGLTAGVVLGVGVGWGLGQGSPPEPAAPTVATFPEAPALRAAMPISGPAPQKMTVEVADRLAPQPAPVPAVQTAALPPAAPVQTAAAPPAAQPAPAAEAAATLAVAKADEAPEATPAVDKGCDAQPTPADKVICGAPKLQRLQRELREAYADALQAHEDKTTLRQRQLAWRDARSDVSDPDKLAALYDARIQKLKAATAEARRLAHDDAHAQGAHAVRHQG